MSAKLEFTDVLEMHDQAYTSSQDVRKQGANDLLFARVTQWDDHYLDTSLEYRGQFDMIRKARRQNLSEMRANPVQVTYIAGRDGDEDTADLLERRYRYDMASPAAKQSILIAQQDQLDCGFGAWRVVTDYENSVTNEQYILREPIHEANNRVFVDPNFNMPDGSDANYMGVIWTVTELGWPAFAESIGVDPDETTLSTFKPPEESYVFPWSQEEKEYHILEFYHRRRVQKLAYHFENAMAEQRVIREEDIDDILDELLEDGYTLVEEREYDTYEVRKYWVAGGGFLNGDDGELVPGTNIPIVLLFGEISKVEDQWVWEGIVRLAKDPQRLRNFMMSYIADIAAKGGRRRPYFTLDQIQGLEWQFEQSGPDSNHPYRVLNSVDEDGNPLPSGPVAYEEHADMPTAAAGLLEAANGAIDDVTNPGIPQDVADVDLSGKAVMALQNRVDMQTYTYLDNYSLALQREAEIYAGMVPKVYDTPRTLGLLAEDGTEESKTVNGYVFDVDKGKLVRSYDLTKGEYKVRTKVTPSYTSRRDQERAQKIELYSASEADPEARKVLLMEIMLLTEGNNDVAKKFARRQLLDMGLIEPESDEDKQYVQSKSEQEQQPDPMVIAAQAEAEKARADLEKLRIDQLNAQTSRFEAETKRLVAIREAKEAGVNLSMKGVETAMDARMSELEQEGKALENAAMASDLQTREVEFDPKTGRFRQSVGA